MQVELVFLVVACPGHFFKTIGFGVDELGVLGDRLVWVPYKKVKEGGIWNEIHHRVMTILMDYGRRGPFDTL